MPSHPFATRETRLEYFDGSSWMSCLAVLERSKLILYREGDSSEDAKDESKIREIDLSEVSVTTDSSTEKIINIGNDKIKLDCTSSAKCWKNMMSDHWGAEVLGVAASILRSDGYRFCVDDIDDVTVLVAAFTSSNQQRLLLAVSFQGGCIVYTTKGIEYAPASSRGELLDAITRANYGLHTGRFSMDCTDGEVRFQTELPLIGIQPTTIASLLVPLQKINLQTHERYYGAFREVVEGRKTGRKAIDDLERNSSSEGGTGGIMARATAMIKQCLSQMQVAAVEQNNVIVGQKAVPPANKEMYVKCQLGDVLIMVSSFISNCPVSSRAQLLEAVTRANFGLKIGQFIMDASDGEILFQTDLVMPRESTVADETLAHLLPPVIITNLVVHERYIPAFEAVRNCSKTAAEAISEVESSTNGRQTPQPAVISSSSAPLLLGPTAEYSSITLSAEKITKVWRKIGNSFPSGILYQAVFASNPVILREIMIEGKRKDKFLESVRREMCIPHPSLTFIHGIVFGRVIEHSGVLEVIEDRNKLLLVTQHCNHTSLLQWLDDVEAKRVEFSEVLALRLAEETALAMSVLHARDIVHTDLTMENVFVNEDNHAVVSSFGMLPHILENTPKDIEFLTTFCTAGRSVFHLDESCLQTGTFSKASDIFAFGILLYHVFVAKSPHTSVYSSEQDLNSAWNDGHYDRFAELFKQKVVEQGLHPKIGNLDHLSPPVKAVTRQLVESCLDRNPSNRPNFEQIAVMLNQAREYVESNSDKHIATTAMPKMTTIAAIHDDSFSNVPPKPPMGPSSSETTFALLPAVAAIKSGLGIEMNKKLDESLREAAEILGIEDEISALKTAKEKAIRICSEMGI